MKESANMRKQTKIAAIISAAALLAVGASMTSFAATGWVEENGTWSYYDKYGDKITEDWAKSGDNWFFLDADGMMATDSLIDKDGHTYYVDANGVMVANRWVELENVNDDSEDAAPYVWYYFQNNGKAYRQSDTSSSVSFKTINGKKYAFDVDGRMLWGWVNKQGGSAHGDTEWTDQETLYYLGESNDGAQVHSSWAMIHVIDDDGEDQDYWFYFGANGKKYFEDGSGYKEKTINGKKYAFASDGHMLSEWVSTPPDSTTPSDYKYFSAPENGARKTKGWFKVLPGSKFDADNSEDGDSNEKWFYADGKGNLTISKIKTINGKKYIFNEKGEMEHGLLAVVFNGNDDIVTIEALDESSKVEDYTKVDHSGNTGMAKMQALVGSSTNTKNGIYYFSDSDTDGSMKTGNQNIVVDGETYSFKLKTGGSEKGRGEDGESKNVYCVNGRKIKAESDDRYSIYRVDTNNKLAEAVKAKDLCTNSPKNPSSGKKYIGDKDQILGAAGDKYVVIQTSGSICKKGAYKDGNDYSLHTSDGKLVGITIKD